ncbi:hypothetical protein P8452_14930 [Trifolium repens]|nr:hypothetical protein QL285_010945 [Trifolium repens]WJX25943.1 hypothetical protein P8452_14930 [Trifolium repens]
MEEIRMKMDPFHMTLVVISKVRHPQEEEDDEVPTTSTTKKKEPSSSPQRSVLKQKLRMHDIPSSLEKPPKFETYERTANPDDIFLNYHGA